MASRKEGDKPKWVDVAFTKETKVEVKSGVKDNAFLKVAKKQGWVEVNPEMFEKGFEFKPNKMYEFRVAAVNSMGVGPWSPVTTLKTSAPGVPQAPVNIKVSKMRDSAGVVLSWDVPPGQYPVLESVVFLAVKVENAPELSDETTPKGSIFKEVYRGSGNKCHVGKDHIGIAAIDTSGEKNAVVFRIAARTAVGYGAATEVRWVQDKK